MSVESADAVVVGAGPNGLVAANVLADEGWSVLVLEAADEPGGAVRSAEITAEGFRNDLCSAFYPLAAASPVLAELELEHYGLRWCHAPSVLAHVLPDDRAVVLDRDVERTARSVARFAAADESAWKREHDQWQRVRGALLNSVLRPFPPIRHGAELLRVLGTADGLRFARMMVLSARRLGQERFSGVGARLLLYGNALHTDLGPDDMGSGLFGWLLSMLGQDEGFPVPEGGADRITSALRDRLQDRGGKIVCGRLIERVLIARGRAVGVRDSSGEFVRARRAVLADVPAPHLYLDMVGAEHLPGRLLDDIRCFEWDHATIKVDWALSGPIPWSAHEARRAGTVHLDTDLDDMLAYGSALTRQRPPERPFLLLGQLSTTDPSRSPPGTETVWAYTHVPRGEWDAPDVRQYADRMQAIVEQHAPGFTDRIIARSVRGPAELEQHDRNLVGGAINGGTFAPYQQLVFRPTPGLGRADTPIDRLYLASSSAHPGGAVHGAPGANAARAALARSGAAGAAYAGAIRRAHRLVYANRNSALRLSTVPRW